jgi:acyl-CoA thioesterase I
MSSRRRRARLKTFGFVGLAVLAVAAIGITTAVALTPPPKVDTSSFTPAPVRIEHPKVAAFVGDSLTAGSGVTKIEYRWSTLVANYFGWGEQNLAQGGTGYVRTGGQASCKQDFCPAFPARVPDIAKINPDVVFILGGRNDAILQTADVYPAVKKFYTDLRAALPNVTIIAVSTFWDNRDAPASVPALNDVIRAEVQAVGGTFIDVGEPYAGKPELIGKDGVHPTDEGYALLAKTIEAKVVDTHLPLLAKSTK